MKVRSKIKAGWNVSSNFYQSYSLIVFAFNEEKNLPSTLYQVDAFLSPLPEGKKECIIVDDKSKDQTLRVAKEFAEGRPWVKVVAHEKNLGIHQALLSGYRLAQMENVVAVPGDGQFAVDELRAFRTFPAGTCISFFRVHKTGYSYFRHFLSHFHRFLNLVLLRVHLKDINWVKIYKSSDLRELTFRSGSVLLETEICAQMKSKGTHFIQAPSQYLVRRFDYSKGASVQTLRFLSRDFLKSYFRLVFKIYT